MKHLEVQFFYKELTENINGQQKREKKKQLFDVAL